MATQKPAGGGGGGAGGGKKEPLKAGAGAPRVTGGAASAGLGAKAFTSGNNISMKPRAGGGGMAHEATHVVQQGAGKLKPGPGAKPR